MPGEGRHLQRLADRRIRVLRWTRRGAEAGRQAINLNDIRLVRPRPARPRRHRPARHSARRVRPRRLPARHLDGTAMAVLRVRMGRCNVPTDTGQRHRPPDADVIEVDASPLKAIGCGTSIRGGWKTTSTVPPRAGDPDLLVADQPHHPCLLPAPASTRRCPRPRVPGTVGLGRRQGASAEVDADIRLHLPIVWYACSLGYAQQEDEVLEATYMNRYHEAVQIAHDSVMRPWTGAAEDSQRRPLPAPAAWRRTQPRDPAPLR